MKLTKKKAIEISIELWTWLAESGSNDKEDWSGWDRYGYMANECPLCEYAEYRRGLLSKCKSCPLKNGSYGCYQTVYGKWEDATTKEDRKEYASQFLEQLKELLK